MRGERGAVSEVREQHPQLLEEWLKGPVILASTSEYRRQCLVEIGFAPDKIKTVSTTDEVEKKDLAAHLESVGIEAGWSLRGDQDAARKVAIGKVEAVLHDEAISPDTLVIAADTITYSYQKHANSVDSQPNTKNADQEQAKKFIESTLHEIAVHYIDTAHLIRLGHTYNQNGLIDSSVPPMSYADHYHEQLSHDAEVMLTANTGVAVRLPNYPKILSFAAAFDLCPVAVYEIVDAALEKRVGRLSNEDKNQVVKKVATDIKRLTDQIVTLHPELITKIAGSIPLHDPEVRKILKISAFNKDGVLTEKFSSLDDGVFKGLPTNVLLEALNQWAEQLESSNT